MKSLAIIGAFCLLLSLTILCASFIYVYETVTTYRYGQAIAAMNNETNELRIEMFKYKLDRCNKGII